MQTLLRILLAAALLLPGLRSQAQGGDYDVFVPIAKYLSQGNADAVSAWFADNLDISVITQGGNASRNQARQIMRNFFGSYTPRSFQVTYTAGNANMKYALGNLNAGGETFLVTIFVSSKGEAFSIQQIKIERAQ